MAAKLYIGLMSGTSLDGVDAALLVTNGKTFKVKHSHFLPYDKALREELLDLHGIGTNELERVALTGNKLSHLYADAVQRLLEKSAVSGPDISAVGCHGQTVRHRPEAGFSLQIFNPALLAELTGLTVVADFRSRDIAAGGQGAPLVPAFHRAAFSHPSINRVVLNIGGIANLSYLPANGEVTGFDTGPGNMLMDAWIMHCKQKTYDENGTWAAGGRVIPGLLEQMLDEAFFTMAPPKSTGRDLFDLEWLQAHLNPQYQAEDVQRTLLELSALSIASAINQYCGNAEEIYVCGGGAYNLCLLRRLRELLHPVKIELSDVLGIAVNTVEAAAFAWLAEQAMLRRPGNLPSATGAKGPRILGAIYAS